MPRKAKVPSSASIKANAEQTYRRFQPKEMLRKLGIGNKSTYFYVYGFTPAGKQVFWGPIPSEEAEAAGCGLISGEVFELDTKQLPKAVQAIKAELLRRGTDPDAALQRMSHKGLKGFLETLRRPEDPRDHIVSRRLAG